MEQSKLLKAKDGVGTLTHVLDRGFDDEPLFDFIDNANMPNMRWAIILLCPRTRMHVPPNSSLSLALIRSAVERSLYR